MRGFLTTSIGVTCAAVLALPLTPPATAGTVRAERTTTTAALTAHEKPDAAALPGSTRSLPLVPLSRARVLGAAPEQGLYRAGVRRFSLVGVIWDDPDTALHGRVQVRTRSTATGTWSGWQDIDTHNDDHGADPGTAERTSGLVRGATAPLWVGDSDGVDLRVRAAAAEGPDRSRAGAGRSPLPAGLRLQLVDPGERAPLPGPPAGAPRVAAGTRGDAVVAASAANTDLVPYGATEIPALSKSATERELARREGGGLRAKPYVGPRPRIVTRRGWGANESLRRGGFVYTKRVKAAFVHHTATGNTYTCAQAPSVIRGIYRYHVKSMGWRDIGYNFLVDKCGTVYEGRAGGVAKAVYGAHTRGFNTDSMGIAVIGSYGSAKPSRAVVQAVARLAAWKLGLYGADPRGKTSLTSGGGNLYAKGKIVRLNVISGHRDGFATSCPGKRLYAKLGTARSTAARYQGR
ncbi:peptidoglycan recognition protein [Streptomyces sp. L2]|uniref:peptidoglycan recognition protein family protein n=1 Tax=Streptomyces sp. L2 TaxID=2162665 RepID=UPI001F513EFD|nr:peptidoglycan recognition protein [Streptomyces sp. L2]